MDSSSAVVLNAYSISSGVSIANLVYDPSGTITGDITTTGSSGSGTVLVQMKVNGVAVAEDTFTVTY